MAWNPSPKVDCAREYGKKFNKKMVIIISTDGDTVEVVSYGKTKKLCNDAKRTADYLFDGFKMGCFRFGD